MIGRIVNFRGGMRTQHTNQMVLELNDEISSKKENLIRLMGKKVTYKAKTHDIIGTITRTHGKRGVVARFNRGMPGQAIGAEVEIISEIAKQ
ncbi:MAG: 50S ribosomal protein L35ae [Candidatus Altarchaeum sp.]|nr:50S ribosomal protein L35ae [Candidatus Altarchaeum sp.]